MTISKAAAMTSFPSREQGCHQEPRPLPALQLSGRLTVKVLSGGSTLGIPPGLHSRTNSTLHLTGNFHMTFGLSSRGPPSVDQTEFSEVQGPALDGVVLLQECWLCTHCVSCQGARSSSPQMFLLCHRLWPPQLCSLLSVSLALLTFHVSLALFRN